MDPYADADTRGLLVLALLLLITLLGGLRPHDPPPTSPPLAAVPADAPAVRRVALGLPVPCGTTDPRVYEVLPGVGPSRARALADAAGRGRLRGPHDLLRIPGFGSKMATRIAPRIEACPTPSETP